MPVDYGSHELREHPRPASDGSIENIVRIDAYIPVAWAIVPNVCINEPVRALAICPIVELRKEHARRRKNLSAQRSEALRA